MIGKRDDRRKEDAVKKAELELKKKKEEAVREVYVVMPPLVVMVMVKFLIADMFTDPRCHRPCSFSTTQPWFL